METPISLSEHPHSGGLRQPDAVSVWGLTPELCEIADVDSGIVAELLSLFIDDSNARLVLLGDACITRDFKVIRAQAHSLKGSALQIGSPWLGSMFAALEHSEMPQVDECRRMMSEIGVAFGLVRQSMGVYLDQPSSGESEKTSAFCV